MMMLKRMLVTVKGVGFEIVILIVVTILTLIMGLVIWAVLSNPMLYGTFAIIWAVVTEGYFLSLIFFAIMGLRTQLKINRGHRWTEIDYLYKDILKRLESL